MSDRFREVIADLFYTGHLTDESRHALLSALEAAEERDFYREQEMKAHKDCDRLETEITVLNGKLEEAKRELLTYRVKEATEWDL